MDGINLDCMLEILSKCEVADLARLRCVNTTLKNIIDESLHPLESIIHQCTYVYHNNKEQPKYGQLLVRFMTRAHIGLSEGSLVRRFKRWLSHKKNVSFGKIVHKMAKTIQPGNVIHDCIHQKYTVTMEKHAVYLLSAIQSYCLLTS